MLLMELKQHPPEAVGGIYGFYEFMKSCGDEKHPEHEAMKAWAK